MSEEFVLVDTSFLVALVDTQDSLHQRAEEIEKELASFKLIFTDVVYGETLSVLSRRIKERRKDISDRKEFFQKIVKKIDKIIGKDLLYLMPIIKEKFFEIKKICLDSGGKLNFNDAFLVVGAKEYGIEWIVSFDSDFDKFLKRLSYPKLRNEALLFFLIIEGKTGNLKSDKHCFRETFNFFANMNIENRSI